MFAPMEIEVKPNWDSPNSRVTQGHLDRERGESVEQTGSLLQCEKLDGVRAHRSYPSEAKPNRFCSKYFFRVPTKHIPDT